MENKIKTFEDACQALNLDPKNLPDVSMLPEKHQKAITALCKLVIIIEALNEGWQPDWSNDDEYKYFPWFDMEESVKKEPGSGLSFIGCVFGYSFSGVGSRLALKSSELAKYAGEMFSTLYEDYFLIR